MGIIIIIINIIIIWIRVDYLHAKCQKRLRVIRKSKEALRKHHLHIYMAVCKSKGISANFE